MAKKRRVVNKSRSTTHCFVWIESSAWKRETERKTATGKSTQNTHSLCALSMVHGHNERLVSVSFVFVKDGCAVLVDRQKSNHRKKTKRSLPSEKNRYVISCNVKRMNSKSSILILSYIVCRKQESFSRFRKISKNRITTNPSAVQINWMWVMKCVTQTIF